MPVSTLTDELVAYALGGAAAHPQHDTIQQTFTEFKQALWRGYTHTPFQQLIDDRLHAVARYVLSHGTEGISRLVIAMPPRHGKTLSVSKMFPAWLLAQNPDVRLITASYGATLAYRNSKFVRNLIDSDRYRQYYPHIQLASDSAAANEWDLANASGGLIAAGVGGGITGHGANLIIIDDPIKSRAEAESEAYRRRLQDWYDNDLLSRLEEPGGAIIVMATRWHQNDLTGYLLQDDIEDWHVLSLPALAEEDDPLGRSVGQALWPENYPADLLHKRRQKMGEYAFAALYQQRPIPSGGGLFDTSHIQIIDHAPACNEVVRFYDLAVTAKRHSDYTVGLKLGVTADEQFVVLDIYRVQKPMPDVERGVVQNAHIDGRNVRIRFEAEKAGIVQLDYLLRNPDMRPYTMDKKPPEGDKYTRATPVASRVNEGKLSIVRASWNRAFLDELAVFPMGEHDDMVDALSGAYDMLAGTYQFTAFY